MTVSKEIELKDFNFWAGAKELASLLTEAEFEEVENAMTEFTFGEAWDETAINDFFWFDGDTIAEILGYENEEKFFEERG